jgi:acyl-CoA thioester hydrolase
MGIEGTRGNGHPHRHRVKVRFHQCDHAGHTNNVAYMAFLEAAREELLYEVGMLEPSTELARLRFTTARVWIDYLAETYFGDVLDVLTRVSRTGNRSFELEHVIVRDGDGKTVAKGGCVLVCFDYTSRKAVPLTDKDRAGLRKFM